MLYNLSDILLMQNYNDLVNKIINSNDPLNYISLLITQKNAAGIYSILPLGLLINNKIKDLIRKHNNKFGIEIQLSNLIDQEMYVLSKRNQDFQTEIFATDNNLCLQATSEEAILKTLVQDQVSYKTFPKYYYQITKKFRKEIRPRNNIIRCIEFEMKDGYSFHINKECALKTYQLIKEMYISIFKEFNIKVHIINADSTSMLANSSEEFIFEDNNVVETKEIINNTEIKGLEIAHIFYLGKHYSEALNIRYLNENNKLEHIEMCSYGIGIYRMIYIYVKQLIENKLPDNLFIFDIAFIYRNNEDEIYQSMQKCSENSNFKILNIDIVNIRYKDKIELCKKISVRYLVYEIEQEIYIFSTLEQSVRKINKYSIYDEIITIT